MSLDDAVLLVVNNVLTLALIY